MSKRTTKRTSTPMFKQGFVVVETFRGQTVVTWRPTLARAKEYVREQIMDDTYGVVGPGNDDETYLVSIFKVGVRTHQNGDDLMDQSLMDEWISEKEEELEGEEGDEGDDDRRQYPEDMVIGVDYAERQGRCPRPRPRHKEEVRVVRVPEENTK
jgi:hypothetical protein